MVKLMVLAGVAGLGLVSTAQARALPKIEGSWPVASIERMLADKSYYESDSMRRCNAHGHCTRTFYEDEVGTRVDVAVDTAGRVYRMVCVNDDRSEGCDSNSIWRYLKPPPSCYTYASKHSIMSGKVVARMAYGPALGKMVPEPYYALVPDRPICLEEGDGDADEPAATNVTILQLTHLDSPLLSKWLGKRVTVTGQLWYGFTAHHHTDVLMGVSRVAAK